MSSAPTIRYRCPTAWDAPPPGLILMGEGPRVRRAYRVLSVTKVRSGYPALGFCTWRLSVESMAAARGRTEIDGGSPHWPLRWDRRGKA